MDRTRSPRRALLAAAASLAIVAPAPAQDCSFTFAGVIDEIIGAPAAPWDGVDVGDAWTLTYTFDPLALDQSGNPNHGVYTGAVTSAQIVIDGNASGPDPLGEDEIGVVVDLLGIDNYSVGFDLATGGSLSFGLSHSGLPGPFTDDHLPLCGELDGFDLGESSLALIVDGGFIIGVAQDSDCTECALPECLLVIGPAPGAAAFSGLGHAFTTQLALVEQSLAVTLEDGPEFVIWEAPAPARAPLVGLDPTGPGASPLLDGKGTAAPQAHEALPQVFAAQVLMWNPQAFPSNPEQSSHGLLVTVLPGGRVVSLPYGTSDGGLEIWAEAGWNAQGQKVLRLPFSIPGF